MSRWLTSRFTKGPCCDCGQTPRQRGITEFYKGRCNPCRSPIEIRQLIEVGVCRGTADVLRFLMKKCRSAKVANDLLRLVHPRVMANVIAKGGVLMPRSLKYRWVRRNGWIKI